MLLACSKIACCAMALANNWLKTDENVLECFGRSSSSRFGDDIAELSTPGDNVPLNAKFTLNQTVLELQVQAKHIGKSIAVMSWRRK